MTSLAGQRLGEYLIEDELGRGSMGAVYRARHVVSGTPVAIKVLLDALASDVSFITRFVREARVIAALHHPNIVRIYDTGRQDATIYFVMEYVRGTTAAQLLRERKRLPAQQVVEIAAQAADALAYAHRQTHVVHRDIKPENLLVDRWSRVKLLDFGLARIEGVHGLTQAGMVVGSLYYVSPEQLLGQPLDGRADVYALGVTIYELLTGRRPYTGQTLADMSDAILTATAVPASQIEPSVPARLEAIMARAMARDLGRRYHDAAELHTDLRALQRHMTAQAQAERVAQQDTHPHRTETLAELASPPPAAALPARRPAHPTLGDMAPRDGIVGHLQPSNASYTTHITPLILPPTSAARTHQSRTNQ